MKPRFTLTERNVDRFHWHGVDIELNLSYDNILVMFQLFDDKKVSDNVKLPVALNMLVVERSLLAQLNGDQQNKLLIDIFKVKLNIDLENTERVNEMTNKDNSTDVAEEDETFQEVPIVDFTIDAERIFSSFLFDYKINLIEQQGKLLWNEFLALFNNLSEGTPMKTAIKYRACEVPKKTKDNADQVKDIKKKKAFYELPQAKAMREARELKAYEDRMKRYKEARKQLAQENKAIKLTEN
ncbi:Gp15 family bacteriophage protein [Bacillus pseudomycoides]|uniref:Gp15 family bacteriophage protein n=1 Tax=Bacillus pseudomycoides TaxID=64104 RepID=UPI003CF8BD4A